MRKVLKHSGLIAATGFLLAPSAHAANFTIAGVTNVPQTLTAGQAGTVTPTGTLTVAGGTVAVTMSGTSFLDNSGTIQQLSTGRAIRNNTAGVSLLVNNNTGGTIRTLNGDAIQVNQDSAITLNNAGSIISLNASAAGNQAIDWAAISTRSNTLTNSSTGLIEAN